jgi:hypothetical protein
MSLGEAWPCHPENVQSRDQRCAQATPSCVFTEQPLVAIVMKPDYFHKLIRLHAN